MRATPFSPRQAFEASQVERDARSCARVAHQSVIDWPRRRRNLFLRGAAFSAVVVGSGMVAWPLAVFVLLVAGGLFAASGEARWWVRQGTVGELTRDRATYTKAVELHGRALAALREMDPDRLPLDTIDEERR